MSEHKKAVLALITTSLIWGAAPPIFKWSLENIPVFSLAFIRFFGAAILFFFLARKNLSFEKKHLPKLILAACYGISFHIPLFFFGLKTTTSINAGVISTAAPLFTIAAASFVLRERIKLRTLLGTFIGMIGVLSIIGEPLLTEGFSLSFIGNVLLLLATLLWALYTLESKELFAHYSPMTVTFYSFFIGGLFFLPFVLLEYAHNPFWMLDLDIRGIVGILFGVFLSSSLAYFLLQWGLSRMKLSEIGVFIYLDPIVTTLVAVPLLGERLTPLFLLGALLVFFGIYVAERRIAYHPLHKLKNHSPS
ncbi:MAG TPA: DMT family transporter [Patescibacteria group bacterium]|nr:DMT family transporter [Patescibacteria group bacterium]